MYSEPDARLSRAGDRLRQKLRPPRRLCRSRFPCGLRLFDDHLERRGSLIARSDSTLRSTVIPALASPAMNRL